MRVSPTPASTRTRWASLSAGCRLWAALASERPADPSVLPGRAFPRAGKSQPRRSLLLLTQFRFLMATDSCFGVTALPEKQPQSVPWAYK